MSEMKNDVESKTDTEDDLSTKELRARAPEKRTDNITTQENGGREIPDLGADAKFFRDERTRTARGR